MVASSSDELPLLVIDDEEPVRRSIGRQLERQGYSVRTAGGCREAEELLSNEAFALVLCDINMPGESGLSFVRRLGTSDPDIAVVMVTGLDDPSLAKTALDAGAYGYIIKPFERNELIISVANALRRRTLEIDRRAQTGKLEYLVNQRSEELRRSNDKLAEALSLLTATLESAADGIIAVDPDGRYSSSNARFAEMWRLPADVVASGDETAALAIMVSQLVNPERFLAAAEDLSDHPDAESSDTLYLTDGRVFERSSKPRRVGDTVVGRVWNFHDVTEHERLELELAKARDKALESSRLKSEFLATMSHEIRTPMNGVIGLTELLLETPLSDTQREFTDGVKKSGEALLAIINDILDFSKIEAHALELEVVDFDLAQAVDDVVALEAEAARARGLELMAYCDPAIPANVRGDVGRLRQVLLNLVSNAIKFTPSGEVVVRARLVAAESDRTMVRLEVADTGVGFDPATAERLFEPFRQADASTTRRYGGTGLGLAICRRLAGAMGGNVGAESRPGQGSTFWLDIPLGPATPPAQAPDHSGRALDGLRVLIVDDNETNRQVLRAQLSGWGVTADVAADAPAAFALLRSAVAEGRPHDLAVLDMTMPGTDGMELGRMIAADPKLGSVRLVLLSSVPIGEEATARAGFAARLSKPVRLAQLRDALQQALAPAPRSRPVPPTPEPPSPDGPRRRLLIVEDNAINKMVATATVRQLGYASDGAGNGLEALDALGRCHYDAVLMDCQMPEMDGFEATAEIRRREAGTRCVPIIAMTAGASADDRERCLAAGMDDYVSKPVHITDLDQVLRRWVAHDDQSDAGEAVSARTS